MSTFFFRLRFCLNPAANNVAGRSTYGEAVITDLSTHMQEKYKQRDGSEDAYSRGKNDVNICLSSMSSAVGSPCEWLDSRDGFSSKALNDQKR